MNYRYLSSPIDIGKMELKNRIVMTSIVLQYAEAGPEGGFVNDQFKNFYFERAAGGAAMVIAGGVATDKYVGYPHMLRLDDDRYTAGYRELADGVHARGSKLCLQFLQTGRYGAKVGVYGDDSTISASAVPSTFSPDVPREMTKEEIREVISNAGKAAKRAVEAGVDAIELCANSGYMISQYLSPRTNKRTDEYGGDLDNRCRFGLEMIQEIRNVVGPDYPLLLRVAGNEYVEGGNGLSEAVEFSKKAVEAGIDAIDVTGGWHETIIPQLPGEVPRGMFVYLAEEIKKAVDVPVISSNRHNHPEEAEAVLASGQADIIGECRTLLADPEWPNKVLYGRENEIRKCLACNQGCFANVFSHNPCKCLFNSYVGREAEEHKITPAENPKKVLVVGAGPAGCEFAYRAAARGHMVTLWEKEDQICKKMNTVAAPPAKEEWNNVKSFYDAMLKKHNVELVLEKEVTASEVVAGEFDEIIVATGAKAKQIPLENVEKINVYTAEDILDKKEIAGKNVLVIGGGSVGCETADYLAHEASLSPEKLYFMVTQGTDKPEDILKMANQCNRNIVVADLIRIGANYDYGCAWTVIKDLRRLGVKLYGNSKILGFRDNTVTIDCFNRKTKELETKEFPCDTIVLAVGYVPDTALFQELKELGLSVHNLGDSDKVGRAMDAILAADDLAAVI